MTNITRNILLDIFFILIFSVIAYGVCTDTDGGVFYKIFGTVTDIYGSNPDYCMKYYDPDYVPLQTVVEWFCAGSYADATLRDCKYYGSNYVCYNGKCANQFCNDNDGMNYLNKGITTDLYGNYNDYCLKDEDPEDDTERVVEYFCDGTSSNIDLKDCKDYGENYKCYNGKCVSVICTDTDGGKNYLVNGITTDIYGAQNDYCDETETNLLYEFFCGSNNLYDAEVKDCVDYGNNYGCIDGKCDVKICNDTDGGIKPLEGGYATDGIEYFGDICSDNMDLLNELYCIDNSPESTPINCNDYGDDYHCYSYTTESPLESLSLCYRNCTDTDEINYDNRGIVTDNDGNYADECINENTLKEYICNYDGDLPIVDYEEIDCANEYGDGYVCYYGKCTNFSSTSCNETDGGIDYFDFGTTTDIYGNYSDMCNVESMLNNELIEYYCDGDYSAIDFKDCKDYGDEYSCEDGRCVYPTGCSDSDNADYTIKGNVYFNDTSYYDICEKDTEGGDMYSNIVWEYVCSGGVKNIIEKNCEDFGNYKCNDGKCIETVISKFNCTYPVLFCDNFDYTGDVINNNWIAYNLAKNHIYLSPNNNRMEYNNFTFIGMTHKLDNFNLQFFKSGYWYYIMDIEYTPVMSLEFDIYISRIYFDYNSETDYLQTPCLSLKLKTINNDYLDWIMLCSNLSETENGSLLLLNDTMLEIPLGFFDFGVNKLPLDRKFNFKITHYFKNREYYNEFQSNIPQDFYKIWIDEKPIYVNYGDISSDIIIYQIDDHSEKEKDSLKTVILEKFVNFRGYIDNFYIYTGDDKYYDTTQDYFGNVSLITYEKETNATIGTGKPGDFATSVSNLWYAFGLRSTASRILFGLLLLCIIGIGLVAMFITTNNPVNFPAIAFIEILFMVLFVYLKLLPMWIPVILGIIAVGIIVWLVKTHFTGGGS